MKNVSPFASHRIHNSEQTWSGLYKAYVAALTCTFLGWVGVHLNLGHCVLLKGICGERAYGGPGKYWLAK